MNQTAVLHLLTEFSPTLVFFVAAQFTTFYNATALFLATTVLALVSTWVIEKRIALFPIFSALFIIFFGLTTLISHNPNALIIADSIYYALLGGLVAAGIPRKKYLLKTLFEATFAMEDQGWRALSIRWAIVFFAAAIGNEIVRMGFSPEVWVNYKFVKVLIIAAFGIYQFRLARRYRLPDASPWGLRVKPPVTITDKITAQQ